jgi:Flp pilus assembly protein TadD
MGRMGQWIGIRNLARRVGGRIALPGLLGLAALPPGRAADLRLHLPVRSEPTPVQRLNQEGVEAVRRKDYDKAEALFLKAYLYDPADPFTLNNLGYVAEVKGDLDRALRFYQLASEQGSTADIASSSRRQLVGRPISEALTGLGSNEMRVNHLNVQAVSLLGQNRGAEAERLLQQALRLDPQNPFTLNNLGVAAEADGEYERALGYFDRAAGTRSTEPVVVTLDKAWRGRPRCSRSRGSRRRIAMTGRRRGRIF